MPRFAPDMENVKANTPVHDRGDYVVKITKATPFGYTRERDSVDVAGCRFGLEIVGQLDPASGELDDTNAGDDVRAYSLYVHSTKAFRMTKSVMNAFAGYGRDDEALSNTEFWSEHGIEVDWDEEEEEPEITGGSGWAAVVGNLVRVTLKKGIYQAKDSDGEPTGDPQETQEYGNWQPYRG